MMGLSPLKLLEKLVSQILLVPENIHASLLMLSIYMYPQKMIYLIPSGTWTVQT